MKKYMNIRISNLVKIFAICTIILISAKAFRASADVLDVDCWEVESNDVLTSATTIKVNSYAGGSLSKSADQDWYKFSIDKPGIVQLSFDHEFVNSGNNYWTVSLITSSNKEIYNGKFVGNATTEQFGTKIGLDAGTYYVSVKTASYYSAAQYSVKVNYTKNEYWEKEFNETIVSANPIAVDTMYNGTIINSSDKDWYSFTLPEDGAVWITFGNEYVDSGNNYWTTTFFTEANSSIASYKWVGNKLSDRDGSSLGLPKGTYFVKIECSSYISTVPYHFMINYNKKDEWEKEFNNTIVTANTIKANSYVYGSTTTSSDVDWYCFTIPKNGKVRISFEHEFVDSGNNYWKAAVFNSSNTSVFERTFIGKDTLKVYTDGVALSAGTYYLRVGCASYTSSATYCFSVEYTTTDSFENIVYENNNKTETEEGDNNTDTEKDNVGEKSGNIIKGKVLEYIIKSEDEVSVKGLVAGDKTINIPSVIICDGKEYDVVGIEKNAFKNNKVLTDVTIDADLDYIGANAFYGCKKLTNLTITGDVTEISSKAFFKCKKLKRIEIKTDAIEKVGKKAFAKIYSRASIIIPGGLEAGYGNMFKKSGIPSRVTVTTE